ncbi:hypothetical protein BD289DRAFT_289429 [Coniella lustricola]|uniref:Uncharacterized protein n=1 Tax=Coniella lustricola TaxID=2025994 RepID=A0A2T3A5C4_9PEZI|nr:hypothetical protein BD289DRAFT_289429 [Coniella lustricola]
MGFHLPCDLGNPSADGGWRRNIVVVAFQRDTNIERLRPLLCMVRKNTIVTAGLTPCSPRRHINKPRDMPLQILFHGLQHGSSLGRFCPCQSAEAKIPNRGYGMREAIHIFGRAPDDQGGCVDHSTRPSRQVVHWSCAKHELGHDLCDMLRWGLLRTTSDQMDSWKNTQGSCRKGTQIA